MAKASVHFTENEKGDLAIAMDFDPPYRFDDEDSNPKPHQAAVEAVIRLGATGDRSLMLLGSETADGERHEINQQIT